MADESIEKWEKKWYWVSYWEMKVGWGCSVYSVALCWREEG